MESTLTRKLPQLKFGKSDNYRTAGGYLIGEVDKDQKSKHKIATDQGEEVVIHLVTDSMIDERRKHPNVGVICGTGGDTCFEVGETVIVEHNSFRAGVNPFDVLYTDEDGKDYFRVINANVLFAVRDSKLVPRKYILLCKPLKDKVYDTFLHVEEEYRRDVAVVDTVWEGCTEYKPGDIILLEDNSDYPLEFGGEDYLKVDTWGDFEVRAIVPDTKWRVKKNFTHNRR
jgi:hypothetical protein